VSSLSTATCAEDFYFLRRVFERNGHRFRGRSWGFDPSGFDAEKYVHIWLGCRQKNKDKAKLK
jgi:hypothetical protein